MAAAAAAEKSIPSVCQRIETSSVMNTPNPASDNSPVAPASMVDVGSGDRVNITSGNPQVSAGGDGGRSARFETSPGPSSGESRRLPSATLLGDIVGSSLARVARWLDAGFVERSLAFSRSTGQYAVLAGAVLTLIYAVVGAIRSNQFSVLLAGLAFIAALAIAQFAATRFLGAATRAINNTPSQISSAAFLECVGLFLVLLAIATLAGGVITSIQLSSIVPFVPALFTSAAFIYFGATALHPRLVNVEMSVGSAGEEAIGLLSFFAKAALKLAPLFFLLLAVGGSLAIAASFFEGGQSFVGVVGSVLQMVPLPIAIPPGFVGSAVVLVACLVPIGAYALFLLQYLVIDLLTAVLSVPGKLDALRR